MVSGDRTDMLARLKSLTPPWFDDRNPVLDGVLTGIAAAKAFLYDLINFARRQTRIATATDGWLDLIAQDYFGPSIARARNEGDDAFRARILASLFGEKGTRRAIKRVLTVLTGVEPAIFEPSRPQDTGAYGAPNGGYGAAGGYGSLLLPRQAFVIAYRQPNTGVPLVAGYGISTGAYSTPSRAEYASINDVRARVVDEQIYAAIERVRPAATVIWVNILNQKPDPTAHQDYLSGGGAVLFDNTLVRPTA
jgi:hypothetical protein